jgi:hypothetical protein
MMRFDSQGFNDKFKTGGEEWPFRVHEKKGGIRRCRLSTSLR